MTVEVVHIASDSASVRETLRQILTGGGVGAVVALSREGADGVAAVKDTRPEVIVLATAPAEEGVPEHVFWYKHAAPEARLVRFAFSDRQESEYHEAGADAVARSDAGREPLVQLLRAG